MSRRGLLCKLHTGERFLVDKERFVIGRDPKSDLCIRSGTISRRHTAISRVAGQWMAEDLKSAPGTYLDGRQIRGRVRLEVGHRISYALPHVIEVLDLDYEAQPGEFSTAIDRDLVFECAGLVCRLGVSVTSTTSNAEADAAFAQQLVATAGVLDGDILRFSDPVELVIAASTFGERLGRPGGIPFDVGMHGLIAGSPAIELLTERTAPARQAWAWINHRYRVPQLANNPSVRGFVDRYTGSLDGVPAELATEVRTEGRGILAWVHTSSAGSLVWIDHGIEIGPEEGDLVLRGYQFSPVRATIAIDDSGYFADVVGDSYNTAVAPIRGIPLDVGAVLDLDGWTFEVVAIG